MSDNDIRMMLLGGCSINDLGRRLSNIFGTNVSYWYDKVERVAKEYKLEVQS